jgi:hypothetical protein
MIRILCEWDIGEARMVFHTQEDARHWLEKHAILDGLVSDGEPVPDCIDRLERNGYITFEYLTLYDPAI